MKINLLNNGGIIDTELQEQIQEESQKWYNILTEYNGMARERQYEFTKF